MANTLTPAQYRGPWWQSSLPIVSYSVLGTTLAVGSALGGALGVGVLALCVFVPTITTAVSAYMLGGKGVAESMGGEPAPTSIVNAARKAAIAVGVEPPAHVYLLDKQEPNAFAAGLRSSDFTVAVTSRLVQLLDERELLAVLAHEMGHVAARDVARNMHVSIAAVGLGGVYEAGRWLSSAGKARHKHDDSNSKSSLGLMLMAAGVCTQSIAHLLQLGASRGAELRADRIAAEAYGADAMVSALHKIHKYSHKASDLRSSASGRKLAFAMISDGSSHQTSSSEPQPQGLLHRIASMLRTHPPVKQRMRALNDLAASGAVRR